MATLVAIGYPDETTAEQHSAVRWPRSTLP